MADNKSSDPKVPELQNWKLLVWACVLGLLVMIVYNVHIYRVRKAGEGEYVEVYRYKRDIKAGETIGKNIESFNIIKEHAEKLGRLVTPKDKQFAIESKLTQPVSRGDFFVWGHITALDTDRPSNLLERDEVAVTIVIDPNTAPGKILRVGDRVNLIGMLSLGEASKAYRIIEGLRVVAIGGRGQDYSTLYTSGTLRDPGVRSYRNITVAMSRDVSLQWKNLSRHIRGMVSVELCSRSAVFDNPGKIDPALAELTRTSRNNNY